MDSSIEQRSVVAPTLHMDPGVFGQSFDRVPFGFTHNLSGLPLFRAEALVDLAHRFDQRPQDYFVAGAAPTAGTGFFDVPYDLCKPSEAMARLESSPMRVLLKRPENHDLQFRRLLDELFAQVVAMRGGLAGERVIRLESSLFITSAASMTPFHFDPEINFFSQIEGEKVYHVFKPISLTEAELERFYLQGQISIGQVDLQRRDPVHEIVYNLRPGQGFHQPQNSPHWVQTQASRSVSYSFVFETDVTRARGQARAANYYLRKFGIAPLLPGTHPRRDAVKAQTMRILIPARRFVRAGLRSLRVR